MCNTAVVLRIVLITSYILYKCCINNNILFYANSGVKSPTEIQKNCIPKILDGIDCIGCAKTGSGKTLAFALPILQKLWEEPYGIFALILTPTRELAYQVNLLLLFFNNKYRYSLNNLFIQFFRLQISLL